MVNNTDSDVSLYTAFHNSGPTFTLIGPALVLNAIGIIGAVMNGFVIFATIFTNTLRGSAHFLMAMICMFESVHQLGHLVFLVVVTSGVNFIDMRTATLATMPQIFALNANLISMFCAAMDRLLAVAAKDLHTKIYAKYSKFYLGMHSALIFVFSTFCTRFVLVYGLQNPNIPTTGCIGEILPQVGLVWYVSISLPMLGSILCYCLIGAIVRFNKNVTKETNMRLLRSLILILCVSVGGYLLSITAYQILFNFALGLGQIAIWELSFIPGTVLNLGAAANAPILYVNSTEYRNAFKHQLETHCPWLFRALQMQTASVHQLNNSAMQNNSLGRQPTRLQIVKGRRVSVWSTENIVKT